MFTATITQLGTFALGYDATPPQISILEPVNGSIITNTLPLISALVVDTGVGIDPGTVEMRLDGQVVTATYITGTGTLSYVPSSPLSVGRHTAQVSARDVLGNMASASVQTIVTFPEDVVPDCRVDAADLQALTDRWRQPAGSPYDLDGDGQVTVADIMRVAAAWGRTCP